MKLKAISSQAIRMFTFCIFLPVLLLIPVAHADTANTINLSQAVDMALKYDFQVATAQSNLQKTKLALKQEVIKIYPQASVENTLKYDLNNNKFPDDFTVTIKETYPTKYNLYGEKIPTSVEAAVWDQLSIESQLQITQANVVYNTVTLYINALKAKQSIPLLELTVKNSQAALTLAQAQLKLGQITKPTELKAANDLANANFNLEKGRSDYNMALRQLGNQLGIKDPSGLELAELPENMTATRESAQSIDWEQLKTEALQKRLELKQAQITIQKAERQLAQMQNQALPDLNISFNSGSMDQTWSCSIGYSFLNGNINGNARKTFTNSGSPITNNFALKFTWNGDFGTADNQIEQAKLGLDNATNSEKQTLQMIEWDLEQARANYELAQEKLKNNEQMIPFYQKQLEIKRLQYQQGSVTQLDVANNEAALIQAQLQAAGSKYDLVSAYEKLQLVSGALYQLEDPEKNQSGK